MLKEIALLSPVFISLFWAIISFLQLGKKDGVTINLGVFMVFAFLVYTSHAVFFNNQYEAYSFIEGIYIFSMLVVYPLYYNYLVILSTGRSEWHMKELHFVPALLFGLFSFLLTLILIPEERIFYVREILINKNLKDLSVNSVVGLKGVVFLLSRVYFILQAGFFAYMGVQLANKHDKQIEEYYSNTEGRTLDWVKFISVLIIIAAGAGITFSFIGRSFFSENEMYLLIPSVIFSSLLFIIGFKGNKQTVFKLDENGGEMIMDYKEDIQSGPNDALRIQLLELFEQNKIYKNVDLRIVSVSEILKTNRTYISKLINEEFQMNFNEFVNKYRIEEAEKLLTDDNRDKYTLEYIAEKSGFGSVSSFTRVFKKFKGQTPGNYKDNS